MQVEDQSEVIAFLGAGRGDIPADDQIRTHISHVFLRGDRAFKLKRAVRLPYADFSTPSIRLAACRKELALDRATAPDLYLDVQRLTRARDGALEMDGAGPLVDAVVVMRRFEQSALLDHMAGRGRLGLDLMADLATAIAAFHADAETRKDEPGSRNIAGVLDINKAGFAESRVFSDTEIQRIDAAFRAALADHSAHLDRRGTQGRIRRCHGDLHLRNICLFEGAVRLFDCIDFNDRLATTDVLYDLAFLVMDLWHRGLELHANRLVNLYLDVTGDEDGHALLPFFVALRAAVRAHVTATIACGQPSDGGDLAAEARAYYLMAQNCLRPAPARLVALGGFSASGKSTMAERLAPKLGAPPGARVIESDRVRKAMFGTKTDDRLPQDAYRPEVSARVYADLATRSEALLRAGCCVVANAVFDKGPRRDAMAEAARNARAPFSGFWLTTSPETLRARLQRRDPGASDATIAILDAQIAGAIEPTDWTPVATDTSPEATLADLVSSVSSPTPQDRRTPVNTDHTHRKGKDLA